MTALRTEAAPAFVELFSCKLLLQGISSPRHGTKQKPELKKGTQSVNKPIPVGLSRALEEPDRTGGWRETAERCESSKCGFKPIGNCCRRDFQGEQQFSDSFSPEVSQAEASAAGKDCHLLSDTLKSNNNRPRLVLGLCWSQG